MLGNRNSWICVLWSELLSALFGVVEELDSHGKRKPSIGQRVLPHHLRQNGVAVVSANILIWILVVAVIATIVSWLSQT